MTFYTACMMRKGRDGDGIRISVMRFNRPYYNFDEWEPDLAPSKDLLFSFKENRIDWEEYVARFRKDVLDKQERKIKTLGEMAKKDNVTLLCWEKTPEYCHRRLLAEEVMKYYPDLDVIIE